MTISMDKVAPMSEGFIFFTFEHYLDAAVREGLKLIDVYGGAPHIWLDGWTPEFSARIRAQIADRGLKVCSYTPEQVMYAENIAAADDALRAASVRYFLRQLDVAKELDAPQMLVCSGWGYLDEPVEAAWARSVASMKQIDARAQDLGIKLAYEPLQPKETNLVYDLPTAKAMLAELDSPNIGICVDTVCMAVAKESLAQWFDAFGTLQHLHLNDGETHGHLSGHLTWGDGTLPLDEYIAELRARDYAGYITLEPLNIKYKRNPDAALHQGVEFVRRALEGAA
ncbi:MAG: sugar phosphate isomerase/epimerase [Propionibacteriaceae bacterium]|jgi:protein FrlC|nr:sugar phosphate isomerase/epimerase [Propionibacteriaceae bacterium]